MSYRKPKNSDLKFAISKQWNVIDDRSGFKIRSGDAYLEPKGAIVYKHDADLEDLRDIPIMVRPELPVPFTSPEPADLFVAETSVYYGSRIWSQAKFKWDAHNFQTWDNV